MSRIVTRILLVVALLVVAYIALAKFNILPGKLNLFKGSEVVMNDTPILVKEVRNIAQLISAEYYGEVYSDLFGAFEDLLIVYGDTFELHKDELFVMYPYLKKYFDKKDDVDKATLKQQKLSKQVDSLAREITYKNNDFEYIKEAYEKARDERKKINKWKNRELYKQLDQKYKEEKAIYDEANKVIKQLTKDLNTTKTKLKTAVKTLATEQRYLANFNKANNLVYIGRGKVQAGFDLDGFDESNIDTLANNKLVIHVDPPKLLDTTINPWFIQTEDEEIPGYEIFMQKRRDYSNEEVKLVKMKCVEQLAVSAINKGIVERAEVSGIKTLESFFQLIGFEEVDVKFNEEQKLVFQE